MTERLDSVVRTVERAGLWLARVTLALGAATMFAMLVLTVVDVFGRYLLNAPVNGANELLRFLIGGVIFLAFPVVTASGEQITVDLLDSFYTDRVAAVRGLFVDAISSAALFVIADWIVFRADRLARWGYVSDFLHLPLAPMAYFIAVMTYLTAAVMALKVLVDIYLIIHPRPRASAAAADDTTYAG